MIQPIRQLVRKGEFGVLESVNVGGLANTALHMPEFMVQEARLWSTFSFDISQLAEHIDEGQEIDLGLLGNVRLPYPRLWLEAGSWSACLLDGGSVVTLLYFLRGKHGVVYSGSSHIDVSDDGRPIRHRTPIIEGDPASLCQMLAFFSLKAIDLINSRRVEIHYRGKILKEHVPSAPTCPIKMSVMPTVRLREGVSLRFESGSGCGDPHKRGRRWHCVSSHLRWITRKATGKREQVRVSSHWRGDRNLGTVRPDFTIN